MHLSSNSPAAWLVAAVAATSSSEVELRDEARAGDVWRVDFERDLTAEFDDFGGHHRREEQRVDSWTDAYRDVECGDLRRLHRTYARLALRQRTQWPVSADWNRRHDGSSTSESTTALAGKTVLFAWDREGEELDREPEAHDYLNRDWLQPLRGDARPRSLLPDRAAEVGDVWLVGIEALREVVEPSGKIVFDSPETGLFDELFAQLPLEPATDQLRVRLADVDDCAGATLARIEFEGRFDARWSEGLSTISLLGYSVSGSGTRTTSIELDCEGKLIWDVTSRHWRNVESTTSFALTVEVEFVATGNGARWTTTSRSRGELRTEARCNSAER